MTDRYTAELFALASTSAEQRQDLLARFCEPHHAALTDAVERALAARGTCLVLDAHSFPTRPLPYEDDQDPDRADICIGTDASHTPAWLRDAAAAAFEALGWTVAIDRPSSARSCRCVSTARTSGSAPS
jgi:N-formylglutamate deformylase